MEHLPPVVLSTSLKVSDRMRKRLGVDRTQAQERPEGQTPGRLIDVMAGTYVPAASDPARPGADDHKKFKSLGVQC